MGVRKMTKEELYNLPIGTKVKDSFDRIGEIVSVNSVKAIRLEVKGGVKFAFLGKVIPEQIALYDAK